MVLFDSTVSVAPTTEPVTTAEAKAYMRISFATDDAEILSLIKGATTHIERWLGRSLITQTRISYWTDHERIIKLPYGPIQLTAGDVVSVTRKNQDQSTLLVLNSSYYVQGPTGISEKYIEVFDFSEPSKGQYPPEFFGSWDMEIVHVCGYGAASAVPEDIRTAILMTVSTWYENRNDITQGVNLQELPANAMSKIWSYKSAQTIL